MQNKTRLEFADYEAENLARLQKMFSRKWEFIFMQVCALNLHTRKKIFLESKNKIPDCRLRHKVK